MKVEITGTVAEFRALTTESLWEPFLSRADSFFTKRIDPMSVIVDTLVAKVTEQTTVSAGLRTAIDGLIPITTSAVTTLGQLKAALEAVIAGGGLSAADTVALQTALDQASADAAGDLAAATALSAAAQALADAVAVNTP